MNTTTNITPAQFDNLNTNGWDLEIDVEGFTVTRETEHGTEQIIVNYRHDTDHLVQVIENDDPVMPSFHAPEHACLTFIENYTQDHPTNRTVQLAD